MFPVESKKDHDGDVDDFDRLDDTKKVLREILLLRHFNHKNIISIRDVMNVANITEFDSIYIVTDYMDTDLYRVIRSKQKISVQHRQWFMYQILEALDHIHSCGVVHRDVKPSNILVNCDCLLKICDFGLSRGGFSDRYVNMKPVVDDLTLYVVTRWYRAPELLLNSEFYDYSIDIWSCGCILAELINRRALFPGCEWVEQLKMILRVLGKPNIMEDCGHITNSDCIGFLKTMRYRPPVPFRKIVRDATGEEIDLLNQMLQFNPRKRPTARKLLDEHPYFQSIRNINLGSSPKTSPVHKFIPKTFRFPYESKELGEQALRGSFYKLSMSIDCLID